MKEKYSRDPLEEYFRKTLDQHEATPPQDLWNRIESGLPSPSTLPAQPWWAPYRFWLLLGAVTGFFVLAFLLPDSLLHYWGAVSPQDSSALNEEGLSSDAWKRSSTPKQVLADSLLSTSSSPAPLFIPSVKDRVATSRHWPSSPDDTAREKKKATFLHSTPRKNALSPTSKRQLDAPAAEQSIPVQLSNEEEDTAGYVKHVSEESASAEVVDEEIQRSLLSFIPVKPSTLPRSKIAADPRLPLPYVRPGRLPKGWSVGLYAASVFTPATTQLPRGGIGPKRLPFVVQSQPPQAAWEGGVRIQKRLGIHWGLEGGISYSEHVRTTAFSSRFRFGDGRHIMDGGHPHSRRGYDHYLSTPGGSGAVELRMEPSNHTDVVQPGEMIQLKAQVSEYVAFLRIPVLASYAIGSGRLFGTARVGLVAEFSLRNDLEISSIISENARVRLVPGFKPGLQWTPARTLSVGYWLSAGATYRWSRRMSISAEPTLTRQLARQDIQGRSLPNPASFGVNVGLLYHW
ncbi:MAG: hypothetical protein NZM43_07320 [Saprospiraceae bacterium]|nr:hypothetical protein [Saprospiraceae bacterium]MDW8484117.1 hypothetical protein [Saprospiraceae bacterium]